jgi:hypothetical protein
VACTDYADPMDPSNPVVRLCAQGMEEESKGNVGEAKALFEQAWSRSRSDWERCIAAHYVARHQPTPQLALHWNQEAMDCGVRVCDGSADEFFASFYLNLAKSHEDLVIQRRPGNFTNVRTGVSNV